MLYIDARLTPSIITDDIKHSLEVSQRGECSKFQKRSKGDNIQHIWLYDLRPPSYPPATPFLRQRESTSPPPPYNFPSLVIRFTSLFPNYSKLYPPFSPTGEEYPALLPSKGENHSTPPPPLLCASCCHNGDKGHINTPSYSQKREAFPAPFMKTSSHTPTNVFPTAVWQCVPNYLEHEIVLAAAFFSHQQTSTPSSHTLHTNHRQRIIVISQSLQ